MPSREGLRRGRDPCRLHWSASGAQRRIIHRQREREGAVDRHDWEVHARRNHSAPFRSPRELGLAALVLAPMTWALPARYSVNGWQDSDPSPPCWTSHLALSASCCSPADFGPARCAEKARRSSATPAAHCVCVAGPGRPAWAAGARRQSSFSVLPQLRPRSRNVKLTLFSYCKAQVGAVSWAANRHGAAWVVEWAQGATLVCVDRLMGPEPRTGTWGLAANIPQQGCSCSRTPFQSLALLDSRGDRYATVSINCPRPKRGKAPPSHGCQ